LMMGDSGKYRVEKSAVQTILWNVPAGELNCGHGFSLLLSEGQAKGHETISIQKIQVGEEGSPDSSRAPTRH
jgi:hypothetical protein